MEFLDLKISNLVYSYRQYFLLLYIHTHIVIEYISYKEILYFVLCLMLIVNTMLIKLIINILCTMNWLHLPWFASPFNSSKPTLIPPTCERITLNSIHASKTYNYPNKLKLQQILRFSLKLSQFKVKNLNGIIVSNKYGIQNKF